MSHEAAPAAAQPVSSQILRVLAREIVQGDELKSTATSNKAATGGGARDLRFSPSSEFGGVLARMFPMTRTESTNRQDPVSGKKVPTTVIVRSGELHWREVPPGGGPAVEHSRVAEIWPPYKPRDEFRFTTVHKFGFWSRMHSVKGNGRVLVLLIQSSDGKIWVDFARESHMTSPPWRQDMADFLNACLNQKTDAGRSKVAVGFIDFATGEQFPQ